MIRFVDIENGVVYNGSKPYIFWFNKEQSTQEIYVKKICILSDKIDINISIPENNIFKLLNMQIIDTLSDININDFTYKNIGELYTNNYISEGTEYEGLYVHMLYISARSENIGEFHEDFIVDNEQFEVAADFYTERENLKINLSNFGVEIPESIQNAIYDSNVHNETKDNILLNRKYKELLLNYWDIIAGRGSYKSLLDSLKWFEYGDLVKIQEIWEHDEWGLNRLNREELNLLLTEKTKSTLANFSKTTYLGLYLALQKYLTKDGEVQYDKLNDISVIENASSPYFLKNKKIKVDTTYYSTSTEELRDTNNSNYRGLLGELTPKLKNNLFKWSVEDLSLKMYLFGSYYESYFMPIHLDLLHSTIESIVFANTIKCLNANYLDRFDYFIDLDSFNCSVKDGSIYRLHDVNVQSYDNLLTNISGAPNTDMVYTYEKSDSSDDSSNDLFAFGVTDSDDTQMIMQYPNESSTDEIINDRLKTYYMNRYNGIGVVIPFNCTIYIDEEDFVNTETVIVSNKTIRKLIKHTLYPSIDGKININFKLLLVEEGINNVVLYFKTAGGRSFIKTIHIEVVGDTKCKLKIYKVKSNKSLKGLNQDDYQTEFNGNGYRNDFMKFIRPYNLYMYTHNRYDGDLRDYHDKPLPGLYRTFIPGIKTCNKEDDGIKYNRVIIFDAEVLIYLDDKYINRINRLFNIAERNVSSINKHYYVIVSKSFVNDWNDDMKSSIRDLHDNLCGYIVRESDGFFFQHHHLVELGADEKTCKLGDDISFYTITDKDTVCVVPDLKYNNISYEDTEWIFKNVSTTTPYEIKMQSIKEPFIGNDIKSKLLPGFYDIIFRYKLGGEWEETYLKSAFRKI